MRRNFWRRDIASTEEEADGGRDRGHKGEGGIGLEAGIGETESAGVGHAGEREQGHIIVEGGVEAAVGGEIGVRGGVDRRNDQENGVKAINTKEDFQVQRNQPTDHIPRTGKVKPLPRKSRARPTALKMKAKHRAKPSLELKTNIPTTTWISFTFLQESSRGLTACLGMINSQRIPSKSKTNWKRIMAKSTW